MSCPVSLDKYHVFENSNVVLFMITKFGVFTFHYSDIIVCGPMFSAEECQLLTSKNGVALINLGSPYIQRIIAHLRNIVHYLVLKRAK